MNPNATRYDLYGGRGIKVSDEWRDFENFYRDMGERPPGKTLDRINPDGNYTKDNCRWITLSEQQQNKRTCRYYNYQGETLNITQLAKKLGVNGNTLYCRLVKYNKPFEEAINFKNKVRVWQT
jgi:hypothetical protein